MRIRSPKKKHDLKDRVKQIVPAPFPSPSPYSICFLQLDDGNPGREVEVAVWGVFWIKLDKTKEHVGLRNA